VEDETIRNEKLNTLKSGFMRTIIIPGGGIGGIVTANELSSRPGAEHKIILVDLHITVSMGNHIHRSSSD
jgi:NADH dehydrogenase FAD-containing subunit